MDCERGKGRLLLVSMTNMSDASVRVVPNKSRGVIVRVEGEPTVAMLMPLPVRDSRVRLEHVKNPCACARALAASRRIVTFVHA